MHARTSALLAALLAGLALAATSGAARTTAPTPVTISILVQKGRPVGGVKRPTVRRNALVRLVVRTDVGREVHVHGYDLEKEVVRGRPTVFRFRARIAGRFEVELHHPDALLAELTVR
ncbi:MAG TPA: hypothetical protein VFB26_07730 [Gaiellaceae bacterium]|nr:hypothetical protein [Gaiellaceae bacterium]